MNAPNKPPLTLTAIVAAVGEERIGVQPLLPAVTNIRSRRGGGSDVTFATDGLAPGDLIGEPRKVALVLWFEAEDWKKASGA
jgi:hypothetical protein